MSAEEKKKKAYVPPAPPPQEEPSMTASQWQFFKQIDDDMKKQSADQLQFFKKFFEDSSLPFYVKMAGVSSLAAVILEGIRLIVMLLRHFHVF